MLVVELDGVVSFRLRSFDGDDDVVDDSDCFKTGCEELIEGSSTGFGTNLSETVLMARLKIAWSIPHARVENAARYISSGSVISAFHGDGILRDMH